MTRITGTLYEHQYIFTITSRSIFITLRNISDQSCRVNQNKCFIFNFFPQNRAVYEIMWKNLVQPDRPLMIV